MSVKNIISILLISSLILLAFDFKGEEAGGFYQIASYLVVVAQISMASLLLSVGGLNYWRGRLNKYLLFLALFLISTVITAFAQNTPFENYRVVVAPYFLLFLSYWFTSVVCQRYGVEMTLKMFFNPLRVFVVLSTFWTLYYGLISGTSDLFNVRYHIISPILPFGTAYLVSSVFARRMKIMEFSFFVLVILIFVIAQTRSNIFVFLVAFVFIGFAYSKNQSEWMLYLLKSFFYGLFFLILIFIFINSIATGFSSRATEAAILDLWIHRLFVSESELGFDLTSASRLGEYHNQMTQLFSSPYNTIIGMGFGAPYTYSGSYADLFASVLGVDAIPIDYWNGGHSLWIYSLYASGLIFGSAFLVFLIYIFFMSLRIAKISKNILDIELRHKVISIVSGYSCLLVTGFTGYPLGSRAASFLIGILIAIILACRDLKSECHVSR